MKEVLLLNADLQILSTISINKAMTLVAMENAQIHTSIPGQFFHSPNKSWPWPTIVYLTEWVYVPYNGLSNKVTRMGIFRRDGFVCAYCGSRGDTLDHVFPKSRGGEDTWENLVTCCSPCNNTKDDRTPEEAGMKLLWYPKEPEELSAHNKIQKEIWSSVSSIG